ncbi:MAG: ABC transporter permease [Candidatus Micrarchaeota archaeon]
MDIITVMKIELKFIMSQGFTSILILLYPFLLMLVVGPLFSSPHAEGVRIAIYSEIEGGLPGLDGSGPGMDSQQIYYVQSRQQMMGEVLSGGAVLGISIERDSTGRKKALVFYDPSKQIVANALALQLQGAIADSSAELVETNLVAVWNNMQALSSDIDIKLERIPMLRSSFKQSQDRISDLQRNVQENEAVSTSNSLSQMQNDIYSMQQSIDQMAGKLYSWENSINDASNYDSKLAYYDARLASSDSQLASLQSSLYSWDAKLAARISQLDAAANTISTYLQVVRNLKESSSGSTYDSLQQVENGLVDSLNQVNSARADLVSMRSELSGMLQQVNSARSEISSARSDIQTTRAQLSSSTSNARNDLNYMRSQLNDASSKLNSATSSIQNAQSSLSSFSNFASSMQSYLSQSASELQSLSSELDSTESLLLSAKSNVAQFLANNPQDYAPSKFEKLQQGRPLRYLDSLFPMIIGLVSMLSCLLLPPIMSVKQKSQGLRTRMRLSYASPLSILFGRFLGDFIVGLIQVLVITFAGSILFGIDLGSHYSDLLAALILAPAVFTALGMLLASFVSNEGSAVLSSLLLSMPMLFLSGIILPIELIHGTFRSLAMAMPLYNIVEMLAKVTIRNAPGYAVPNLIASIGYVFLFLSLSYFMWRNKD